MSHDPLFRVAAPLASLAGIALLVLACSSAPVAAPGSTTSATPAPQTPFPTWPVQGNTVRAPAPSDLPEEVRNLLPLIDCGSELIIDPGSPAADPGPGWTPTTANANRQAIDCLMSAWAYRQKAQMTKSQLTAAGDEFYILYRLPGDGSIVVYVRDLTPSEQELLWYTTVCDQLTLDQGQILPTECRNQRTLSEPDD